MNYYFFDQEHMSKYYNCSGRTYDEWKALGKPNVLIGSVYALLGVFYLAALLPFMVVFVKSDLMKYSCYKIMFFIGLVDSVVIPIGGFYCGWAAAVGFVFCMAPDFSYIMGAVGLGGWFSASTACMLLSVNRCIDLMNPNLGQLLFNGKKTLLWLLIPIIYYIYSFFFHSVIIFNSNFYAWFFDPFIAVPERHGFIDNEHYPHFVHSTHNFVVIIVMLVSYTALLIYLWIQGSKSDNRVRVSKLQRQTFIQSTLVCTGTFIACFIYVYMQFFPTPIWIIIFGEICWQTSHGAAGLSYTFFNPTMRKELKKICSSASQRIKPSGTGKTHVKTITTTSDSGLQY